MFVAAVIYSINAVEKYLVVDFSPSAENTKIRLKLPFLLYWLLFFVMRSVCCQFLQVAASATSQSVRASPNYCKHRNCSDLTMIAIIATLLKLNALY